MIYNYIVAEMLRSFLGRTLVFYAAAAPHITIAGVFDYVLQRAKI